MSIIRDVLVKITTDNSGLEKGLDAAKGGLKRFSVAAAAALGTATGAFAALTIASVNSAQQIERFSKLSNASTQEFQRWAAAVSTVGFEQEKLADVFKDVNDRIGDFMSTGGGPMADFFEKVAPKVGVTAEQFRKLSGPQALQLYVDTLQKAGANQQDMTFYLEAMAGDAAALIPLLRNNGAELKRLGEAASRAGAILSDETLASLAAAKKSVDEIQVSFSGFTNQLVAAVAPALQTASASLNTMMEAGGPVSQAIDRIAESFGALAAKMASPEFINAATMALTGFINLASTGADAIIWLTENTETLTYALAGLAVALAALGGPLTWIAGLTAAAVVGLQGIAEDAPKAGKGLYDAEAASKALNAALGIFHGTAAPSAGKAAIALANDNYTLARSALTAAEAELAKVKALQQAHKANPIGFGQRGRGLALDRQEEEATKSLEQAANDLAQAWGDLDRAGRAVTGADYGSVTLPGAGDVPPPGLDPFDPDAGKGGKGGGKEDDTKRRLEALQRQIDSEREIQLAWYEESKKTLDEARAAGLLDQTAHHEATEKLEQEHADRMKGIDKRAMDAKLENARTILGGLSDLMSTNSKKLFKVGQLAAIAQATIDGLAAAVSSYKWGAALGGPALGAVMAGTALAKTAAMISQIKSASPNGGGGGTSSGGGATAATVPEQSASKVANYQISGDVLGKQSTAELFRSINEGIKDGYTIYNVEWVG